MAICSAHSPPTLCPDFGPSTTRSVLHQANARKYCKFVVSSMVIDSMIHSELTTDQLRFLVQVKRGVAATTPLKGHQYGKL